MSEKPEIEKYLLESTKLEGVEIKDTDLKLIDSVIQDYVPEIAFIYQFREDEAEEQQIKTGRLHENRILGIILKFYLAGKIKITTGEVEQEYKRYFKEIARSTISTYLNMLKKEFTLYKERDGRTVYYIFYEEPPEKINPFWFTRIFCIVPAYFDRALYFSQLYRDSEKYIQKYINQYGCEDKNILKRNFKFLTGLIILNIFRKRSSKCVLCQFSKREVYSKLEEMIEIAIKDRSDVLPEELMKKLINKLSELPLFNGIQINGENDKEIIPTEITRCADIYKKDIDFQIMVATRRKDVRLKQKKLLEEDSIE
ncbi:MAG: hypothetical protein ACFE9I_14970 [Candidatus Hermodarchaeota archaeon]